MSGILKPTAAFALGHLVTPSPCHLVIPRRAHPSNGIALNALYDRTFDRGLICFDEKLRVVVSERVRESKLPPLQRQALLEMEGRPLRLAYRFTPDPAALAYRREHMSR